MASACMHVFVCVYKVHRDSGAERWALCKFCAFWPAQCTRSVPPGCPATLWVRTMQEETYRSSAPEWSQSSWCTGSWSPACLQRRKTNRSIFERCPTVVSPSDFCLESGLFLGKVHQLCKHDWYKTYFTLYVNSYPIPCINIATFILYQTFCTQGQDQSTRWKSWKLVS